MAAKKRYQVIAYTRDESKDKPGLYTFVEAVAMKERFDATDPDTLYMIEDTEEE